MQYGLGIPLPPHYAQLVALFRADATEWALRPMRSDPHISIKGPAALDNGQNILATIREIASNAAPFLIQLTAPAMFDAEPILYLGVESLGWWRLHRALVNSIAVRTGAEMHRWEIKGWVPHMTILRAKPELADRRDELIDGATRALSPFPLFEANILRMYRRHIRKHDGSLYTTSPSAASTVRYVGHGSSSVAAIKRAHSC